METFAQRLKFARKREKLTQDELSEKSGVGQPAISKIERAEVLATTGLISLARACKCDPEWLETGRDKPGWLNGRKIPIGNVDAARAFTGEVPVITWVQAGAWQDIADTFRPEDAERHIPISRGHSIHTYALKVRGDSMTSPYGKSYPEGCYVVVDPGKRSPVNGDRIIAITPGSKEATFKIYKDEDGRKWLAPLNATHPIINEPFEVLGTVIYKFEAE